MTIRWRDYKIQGFHDELIRSTGRPRPWARRLCKYFSALSDDELRNRQAASEAAIRAMGITFTVYSEKEGSIDRHLRGAVAASETAEGQV